MIKAISFSLLTIVLAVACGSPAGTPQPTPQPSPPGGPSDGPSPTPPITPSPIPTPAGEGISHPTGPSEVVLQYEVGGGFVPMEFYITQAPQFSLYGDGTVIWRPQDETARIGFGAALPPFLHGRMSEDGIQALLRFALGQGRLAGARETYRQDMCADCPSTTFRINADGMDKVVTIDALGEVNEGPDALDRNGFNALAQTLTNFDEQARNGVAGDVVVYDPSHYRVVLSQAQPEMGEFDEWPWPELTIDDFAEWEAGWQRRAVLQREQVARVAEVPSGGIASIAVEDTEGGLWTVGVRPLLPDEIAAEAN
jgi:hypothetical protein